MPTPSELRQAWKAFLQPLSSSQTAVVIDDLFALGISLRAGGNGPCLAPDHLTLQTTPTPHVTAIAAVFTPAIFTALEAAAAAAGSSYTRADSFTDAELIAQAAWAWVAAWVVSESPGQLTSESVAPAGMSAPAWAWCRRAFAFDSPFADVAAARAAIPT